MRYEMQNYVKFTKKTNPNVGANKKKHIEDWKYTRKIARKHKLRTRNVFC